MNEQAVTFSRKIKDELSLVACNLACCRQTELTTAFLAAGKTKQDRIVLASSHVGCVRRLAGFVGHEYGIPFNLQSGRELLTLSCRKSLLLPLVEAGRQALFRQTADHGGLHIGTLCCRQAFVRALFLICGSISEPAVAYHMELAIRSDETAALIRAALESLDIRSSVARRGGCSVIYIREGQYIADYLLLAGAHQSLLAFESLRVEKEMRNSVNRVVNCDSANTQRLANTAARQLDLIRTLHDRGLLGLLPPNLQEAAKVRLENPDLSLKELGVAMEPSLGKSGMNHRLMRLEKIARELLARKEF